MKRRLKAALWGLLLLAAVLVIASGGWGKKDTWRFSGKVFFAHAGYTRNAAPNTATSFSHALENGFNGLETDVRTTSGGEFILFHDLDMQNRLGIGGRIHQTPYSKVRERKVHFQDSATPDTVPLLKSLLSGMYGAFEYIYLDLKREQSLSKFTFSRRLTRLIRQSNTKSKIIAASTDLGLLAAIEWMEPGIVTCLEGLDRKTWRYKLIPYNLRPDMLAVRLSRMDDDYRKWLKRNDFAAKCVVFGVEPDNYRSLDTITRAVVSAVKPGCITGNNDVPSFSFSVSGRFPEVEFELSGEADHFYIETWPVDEYGARTERFYHSFGWFDGKQKRIMLSYHGWEPGNYYGMKAAIQDACNTWVEQTKIFRQDLPDNLAVQEVYFVNF